MNKGGSIGRGTKKKDSLCYYRFPISMTYFLSSVVYTSFCGGGAQDRHDWTAGPNMACNTICY